MSLSFVSKSIQTARSDGGFEEEEIENSESHDGRRSGITESKPLFEQLRANQEQDEEEREEQQRALMRGTLALDDDDAKHLDNLYQQRQRLEDDRKQRTVSDMASFHAAQADRREKVINQQHQQSESTSLLETSDGTNTSHNVGDHRSKIDTTGNFDSTATNDTRSNSCSTFRPTVIRKRKRRVETSDDTTTVAMCGTNIKKAAERQSSSSNDDSAIDNTMTVTTAKSTTSTAAAQQPINLVANLLSGYSSSSSNSSSSS